MVILGIHTGHNSSAALMVDGAIVGAVQEERFSKRKNQVAMPVRAVRHLVDAHLDGDASRISRFAFATREIDPIGLAVSRYSDFSVADHVREMHEYWRPVFYDGAANDGAYWIEMYRRGAMLNADHNVDTAAILSKPLQEAIRYVSEVERPRVLKQEFELDRPADTIDHHACHAFYAFRGAPVPRERWGDRRFMGRWPQLERVVSDAGWHIERAWRRRRKRRGAHLSVCDAHSGHEAE
jgi:carbamoyltransferase